MDPQGRPVAGIVVRWSVETGGAVHPSTSVTASDGVARAAWTLDTLPGPKTAIATAAGLELRFHATCTSAPVALVVVSGDNQSGVVDVTLPTPLIARALDSHGNPVAGVPVTWIVSGGDMISPGAVTSDSTGSARGILTLGPTAGMHEVLASTPGASPAHFTAAAGAGAAQRVRMVSGDGQRAILGGMLTDSLIAQASDVHDNPVAGVPVTWTVIAGGGSISPASSATGTDGRARARWTVGGAAGQNRVSVRAPGLPDTGTVFSAMSETLTDCLDEAPATEPGCNLSNNPAAQETPSISGNRVVWVDYRSGGAGIYLADLTTGTTTEVTPPGTWNVIPAIAGDRIVYVRLPASGNWQFISYDIPTGIEAVFDSADRNNGLGHFSMSGNRVAWHDRRNNNWDVYLYDFSTHAETRLTSDPADQGDPSIFGDLVVWWDKRQGNFWGDVYLYDLAGRTERRVTATSTLGRSPIVTGDRIVWGDVRGGSFTLYAEDLLGPPQERLIPTSLLENDIAASGSYVAWVNRNDANPVFFDDVFLYDFTSATELRVTHNPARQWHPALSGDYLVWEDSRNGNADIFITRVSKLLGH
jgi:beta propeller repeat protein